MRHDLKTTLNGIIRMPEVIIEEGGLNQDQIECLQMIEDNGYVTIHPASEI